MPSSSYVEIDISNNETAILENPDVVIKSPTEIVISPTPKKKMESSNAEIASAPPAASPAAATAFATAAEATAEAKEDSKIVTPRSKKKGTEKKRGVTLDSFFKGKKKELGAKQGEKKEAAKKEAKKTTKHMQQKEVQKQTPEVQNEKKSEGVHEKKSATNAENESEGIKQTAEKVNEEGKMVDTMNKKKSPSRASVLDGQDDTSPGYAVAVALAQARRGRRGKKAGVDVSKDEVVEGSKEQSVEVKSVEEVVEVNSDEVEKSVDSKADVNTRDVDAVPAEKTVDLNDETNPEEDDKTVDLEEDKMRVPRDDDSVASVVVEDKADPEPVDASNSSSAKVPITEVVVGTVPAASPLKTDVAGNASAPKKSVKVSPVPIKSSKKSKKPKVANKSIADAFGMFVARPAKAKSVTKLASKEAKAAVTEETVEMTGGASTPIEIDLGEEPAAVAKSREVSVDAELPAKTEVPTEATKPATSVSTQKSTEAKSTSSTKSSTLKGTITSSSTPKKGSTKTKTPSKATAAKSAKTSPKPEPTPTPLSEENSARMKQYSNLRERYVTRAVEVASRSVSDDFEEEKLNDAELTLEKGSVEVAEDGGFPDELLLPLLVMVQGSNLPLSLLSKSALDTLSEFTSDTRSLTLETISSKVKLIAQRKPYLSGNPPPPSEKPTSLAKLDCFEDANECYLWRWELSSIDLLPQKEATKVKKARTMRKKLQSHHAAIFKLISAIDAATTWLRKNPTSSAPSPSVPVLAKVSDMEEKVLKFEREEEKVRLLKEAKAQKEQAKVEELAAKQKEKERLEQERLNAKKVKEEEKAAAVKEREEAKLEARRKKEEEKLKLQREAEVKEEKRKARMMSFFSMGSAKKKQKTAPTPKVADKVNVSSFDVDAFHSMIDSKSVHATNIFPVRKQHKTKDVKVSVHVTVLSDNPFAPQPYDEEKIISVPNKYKFLGFHEDHRPPYHGTWSKRSAKVTGRTPFGKDTEYLNYEVDSEAEWEQEDEDGEDCDKSEGEEEEEPNDDDNDSFLAAEDDVGLDDDDEETKNLRKKKLQSETTISAKACVIAPRFGGLCHELSDKAIESVVEGFELQDAVDLLSFHAARVLSPEVVVCLDALPHTERNEQEPKAPVTQKMSLESSKILAQFVHNSTVNSKEKIITELLNAHPTVASSRAQAMRELEVIAEKRRLPKGGGVVWEVKTDHLKALELKKEDLKPSPPEEVVPANTTKAALEKVAPVISPSAPAATSPKPTTTQPKQSKKRSKPAVSAASANLFAAFMAKASKKQKTE